MTELNSQMIRYLTSLSRIQCTAEEEAALLEDLKKILDYVEKLSEVDTDNVPPCNHVLDGISNVMREDAIGKTLPRETFLANAPSQIGGLIRVPQVLKQGDR